MAEILHKAPCISADTSSFFDYDLDLKNKLVVNGFDDSWQIHNKVNEVLNDYDLISQRCLEYAVYLNTKAQEKLITFLES